MKDFAATNGNVYIDLAKQRDLELAFTFCLAGVVFFVACKMIKILRFVIFTANFLPNSSSFPNHIFLRERVHIL